MTILDGNYSPIDSVHYFLFMSSYNNGRSVGVDFEQEISDVLGGDGVKISGWFVSADDGGVMNKCSCYRYALLFPTREFSGEFISFL